MLGKQQKDYWDHEFHFLTIAVYLCGIHDKDR